MNEQIFLSGAPIAGFGAIGSAESETRTYGGFVLGGLAGSIGGGYLGHAVTKGVLGTVAGTILGGVAGSLLGMRVSSGAPTPPPQMQPGEVWTTVGALNLLRGDGYDEAEVQRALISAFAGVGLKILDKGVFKATDVGVITFALTPTRPTTLPSSLPLASYWADKITFSNTVRAPAKAPSP
jgi:hypothetical protein